MIALVSMVNASHIDQIFQPIDLASHEHYHNPAG